MDKVVQKVNASKGYQVAIHVDAASGGFIAPFQEKAGAGPPAWDFRLSTVLSISASGHKFGESICGTGWVIFRQRENLAEHIAVSGMYFCVCVNVRFLETFRLTIFFTAMFCLCDDQHSHVSGWTVRFHDVELFQARLWTLRPTLQVFSIGYGRIHAKGIQSNEGGRLFTNLHQKLEASQWQTSISVGGWWHKGRNVLAGGGGSIEYRIVVEI
jgi:hypothetical protein